MTRRVANNIEHELPIKGAYDFDWVFEFLRVRVLEGVESVTGGPGNWCYTRLVEPSRGVPVSVRMEKDGLIATLPNNGAESVDALMVRVNRVFDVYVNGDEVEACLIADPLLRDWVKRAPGLRVVGAWDRFETTVRAILGQQVSVARGVELANKMVVQYGAGSFPTPEQLVDREIAELGMPGRRGRAISELAQLTIDGSIDFNDDPEFDEFAAHLTAIDGIGPWTANYARMRVAKDPDAFPDNDWIVLKQLKMTAAKARARSLPWQPWRAYALMYIWYGEGQDRAELSRRRVKKK